MGEPSSTSIGLAGVAANLGLGAALPDPNPAALVGAFGGAFIYVVFEGHAVLPACELSVRGLDRRLLRFR